jgi:hypothetical protein
VAFAEVPGAEPAVAYLLPLGVELSPIVTWPLFEAAVPVVEPLPVVWPALVEVVALAGVEVLALGGVTEAAGPPLDAVDDVPLVLLAVADPPFVLFALADVDGPDADALAELLVPCEPVALLEALALAEPPPETLALPLADALTDAARAPDANPALDGSSLSGVAATARATTLTAAISETLDRHSGMGRPPHSGDERPATPRPRAAARRHPAGPSSISTPDVPLPFSTHRANQRSGLREAAARARTEQRAS